jgi:hypothetical protein
MVKKTQEWQKKNPEKKKAAYKKWRETHKEYVKKAHKEWDTNNIERKNENHRRWRSDNPEKYHAAITRAAKVRLSTLKGRLNLRMSSSIRASLKPGAKAGQKWEDLVGFTVDELKKHLEKLFKPGMTWENFGTVWEIDHKIPISVFNFEKPEHLDFRLCWNLKNLQPLEKFKNRSKGAKLDKPFQPSLPLVMRA